MNCDKCCGCVPPITTYNPSVADNFPTILQQVEYLKAMLKKYPSQQWFITQEKVTEDTIKLDRTKVSLRGRDIAEGDFILGNTEYGTTLMFQYTGATIELTNYVVEFVGIYSNQSLAEQALDLAKTNEKDIGVLDGQVAQMGQDILNLQNEASIEITLVPALATSGTLTDEQYATLVLNDNCYIKLNDIIYTLSKRNPTQGYSVYSTGYLSDTKAVQTITITNLTKGWVMTSVKAGSTQLYQHQAVFTYEFMNVEQTATIVYIDTGGYEATSYEYFKHNLELALAVNDKPQLRISPSATYTALGFYSTDVEYGFYYGSNAANNIQKQTVTFSQEHVSKI